MKIRRLAPGDVRAVAALTRANPQAAQWSDTAFERLARAEDGPEQAWLADDGNAARAYLVARRAADEVEILNIVVEAGARRQGIAGQLLEHALTAAEANGARRAFLEVRESNHAAIALYRRHGFQMAGRRAGYYRDPVEDAVILSRELGKHRRTATG